MAKTKDISTLETISANSAAVLGKTSDGKVGYISGLFTDQGKLADIPDISNLASKVTKELDGTQTGDKAKIQNQHDGGVMQYVKQDGSNSAVVVNDGSQDVGAEICSLDSENNGSRIIANTKGAYYSVGKTVDISEDKEIATKGDLVPFSPAELVGVSEDHTATCHNAQDGGSLKYETPTQTAFIGVNCDNENKLLAEFALTGKKDGTSLKQGNRLLAKEDGIFYTKLDNLDTPEDSEVATLADVNKKLDIESKGTVGKGTFTFTNGKAGATIKYADDSRKMAGTVGVFDGNTNGILVELGAGPMKLSEGPRIFLDKDKAVYCKGKLIVHDDDEILTKKDIADLTTKVAEIATKIEELETKYAAAVQEVNLYTDKVKQLIEQKA